MSGSLYIDGGIPPPLRGSGVRHEQCGCLGWGAGGIGVGVVGMQTPGCGGYPSHSRPWM